MTTETIQLRHGLCAVVITKDQQRAQQLLAHQETDHAQQLELDPGQHSAVGGG